MSLFDWLATDAGRTFLLALVGLMQAGSYYLWYLSHRDRMDIRGMLNGHLQQHTIVRQQPERKAPAEEV